MAIIDFPFLGNRTSDPNSGKIGAIYFNTVDSAYKFQSAPGVWSAMGGGGSSGYLLYAALMTQTSTNDPVAIVLANALGGTVVWTRDGAGSYSGTLPGAFPVNKVSNTNSFIDIASDSSVWQVSRLNDDSITVRTFNATGDSATDGLLNNTYIEVKIYD